MTNSTKIKILAVSLAVLLTACGGAEERKTRYMEKGKNYLAEKNYDKAKIEFKNVMQIDPKYADVYYYMGLAEEQNNELKKAVSNYQQAVQLDMNHLDAKAKLARIYVMVGTDQYIEEAEKLLHEVLSKNSEHIEAQFVEATILAKNGKQQEAIVKLKKIVEKDPSFIDAYTTLSFIYISIGKDDSAIALLQTGIEKNKTNAILRGVLAQALLKNNRDIAGAEKLLKEIINLEPDNYKHRISLAAFYGQTDQSDKAVAVLRQAIQDNNDDASRYLVLVEYLASKKGVKEAEDELLAAIKEKPELYELQFSLAEFYQKLQVIDKAIVTLASISDKNDVDPVGLKAKIKLAGIYTVSGDMKKAQSLLDVVLKESPNDADALFVKGKLAFLQQDNQTAINALRSVLKDFPKNSDAALLLAQAHKRNNEIELAKETLMRVLEADPANPKNHVNFANYLASENDMKGGEETVDKALVYFKTDYDLLEAKLKFAASRQDEKNIKDILEKLKEYFPSNTGIHMQYAQYYLSKKQYPQALEELELAAKLSPMQLEPMEAIVKTYYAMGQEKKAVEKLQARLSAQSDDVIASFLLAQIYASRNERVKALEYYVGAMKQPKWDAPYMGASSVHLANKDVASALKVLEDGASKVSNPISIQMQIASIYEYQKEFEKAILIYEKVLDMNSSNQMAANNLASLLLDYRADDKSIKRAEELVGAFSKAKHPALLDTFGWAKLKNNDTTQAISVLEEVNRIAPDVGVFQYHLGMAYHQAGDTVNAKRYLSMASASKQDYPGKDKVKGILDKL